MMMEGEWVPVFFFFFFLIYLFFHNITWILSALQCQPSAPGHWQLCQLWLPGPPQFLHRGTSQGHWHGVWYGSELSACVHQWRGHQWGWCQSEGIKELQYCKLLTFVRFNICVFESKPCSQGLISVVNSSLVNFLTTCVWLPGNNHDNRWYLFFAI